MPVERAGLLISAAVAIGASLACTSVSQASEFSSMSFMVGTWSCSGQAVDGTTFRVTETSKLSADGTRLVTSDSSGKVSTELRYDAARKFWVETSVNANDGSNSSETSPGWDGNTLVFTGQVNLKGVQSLGYRSTTTKLSNTRTKQVDELQGPTGWMQFDTATCEKTQ